MRGKRLALLVAAAFVGGVLGGAAGGRFLPPGSAFAEKVAPAKVIRAEKVEIVDGKGAPRAWIEVDDDGNAGLFLGSEGCILASLSLVGDGKPRLDLGDNCTVRAVLKLGVDGSPSLTLYARDKKAIWAAP